MKTLTDLEGIDSSLVELLEATGFMSEEALVSVSAQVIADELEKANGMLQLVAVVPSLATVESWQLAFGGVVEKVEAPVEEVEDFRPIEKHLLAKPLSEEFLREHDIELSELPCLLAVDEPVKKPKTVATEKPVVDRLPEPKVVTYEEPKIDEVIKFDASKAKTFEEFRKSGGKASPLQRSSENDLTKAPRPEVNKGIDPSSKRYLRGVLHKDASKTKLSAAVFIVCQILVILSVLPVGYVLMHTEAYMWAAITPALWIVAGLLYLTSARAAVCPVCRQRQFAPKACRKHVKAHTLPLFGHMLPTALHMLVYKWFHCIFCGTSIRVKE